MSTKPSISQIDRARTTLANAQAMAESTRQRKDTVLDVAAAQRWLDTLLDTQDGVEEEEDLEDVTAETPMDPVETGF